jgi:hypothetical protein
MVYEAIAREYPHGIRDFGRDFCIQRSRIPRTGESDSKVSANITKIKNICRLAAVLLPLPSSVFSRLAVFLGNTMENSGKQNPKMGFKSPPRADMPTFKWLL